MLWRTIQSSTCFNQEAPLFPHEALTSCSICSALWCRSQISPQYRTYTLGLRTNRASSCSDDTLKLNLTSCLIGELPVHHQVTDPCVHPHFAVNKTEWRQMWPRPLCRWRYARGSDENTAVVNHFPVTATCLRIDCVCRLYVWEKRRNKKQKTKQQHPISGQCHRKCQ